MGASARAVRFGTSTGSSPASLPPSAPSSSREASSQGPRLSSRRSHEEASSSSSSWVSACSSRSRVVTDVRVVVDWDGTVTEIDGLHLVLLEFGDEGIYDTAEARLGRELTINEVIALEFRSVRAPLAEVVAWVRENVRVRDGLAAFARTHQPLIVSSGLPRGEGVEVRAFRRLLRRGRCARRRCRPADTKPRPGVTRLSVARRRDDANFGGSVTAPIAGRGVGTSGAGFGSPRVRDRYLSPLIRRGHASSLPLVFTRPIHVFGRRWTAPRTPRRKSMLSLRTLRALGLTLAVAVIGIVAVSAGTSATAQAAKIRIWVDQDRLPAMTKVANDWAATKGGTIEVVQKGSDSIRADVRTVQPDTAPDLIVGAHDWVGELSSNGSIVPLNPSKALVAGVAKGAVDAFSYGVAIKRLYGAPVYTENVALITNTKLATVPKTWASLESQALAAKKKLKQKVGIAVQQGNGDAYHMYPFFTSLCGYIFGKNSAGNLDPSDIGVANKKFLANAPTIDRWNKTGLIRSTVTDGIAKTLFTTGKTAFYVTGPWFLDDIKKSGVKFAVSAFPNNKCTTSPFTGVGGLMVTSFAVAHDVESLAKDF